jgi:Arc/MetJ family transcription regulator
MRTVIDVDDVALAKAAEVLGTRTKVETVNAALRLVAEQPERLALMDALFAANDLSDPSVMRGTQRT